MDVDEQTTGSQESSDTIAAGELGAAEGCYHAGVLYGEGDQICVSRYTVAKCERLDGRLQWRQYPARTGECDDHPDSGATADAMDSSDGMSGDAADQVG
jgi:hypothetical protein